MPVFFLSPILRPAVVLIILDFIAMMPLLHRSKSWLPEATSFEPVKTLNSITAYTVDELVREILWLSVALIGTAK
jgi:hypothetical protein